MKMVRLRAFERGKLSLFRIHELAFLFSLCSFRCPFIMSPVGFFFVIPTRFILGRETANKIGNHPLLFLLANAK